MLADYSKFGHRTVYADATHKTATQHENVKVYAISVSNQLDWKELFIGDWWWWPWQALHAIDHDARDSTDSQHRSATFPGQAVGWWLPSSSDAHADDRYESNHQKLENSLANYLFAFRRMAWSVQLCAPASLVHVASQEGTQGKSHRSSEAAIVHTGCPTNSCKRDSHQDWYDQTRAADQEDAQPHARTVQRTGQSKFQQFNFYSVGEARRKGACEVSHNDPLQRRRSLHHAANFLGHASGSRRWFSVASEKVGLLSQIWRHFQC